MYFEYINFFINIWNYLGLFFILISLYPQKDLKYYFYMNYLLRLTNESINDSKA